MYKEIFAKCRPTFSERYILESLFRSRKCMFIKIYAPGIPNFGLLPIDPLRITELGIDQGSGPVSIKLNFRDLDISNIGTAKINHLK